MCEIAVFINENGTGRRIARSIIKAEAGKDCVSLLDSGGRVIKVEGTYIVAIDVTMNEISLKESKKDIKGG